MEKRGTNLLKLVFTPFNFIYKFSNITASNYKELFECNYLKPLISNIGKRTFVDYFNECQMIDKAFLDDLIKTTRLVIWQENKLYSQFDIVILKYLGIDKYFEYYTEEALISEIIKEPKNYLIFEYDIEKLLYFSNLGCWTALRTELFYAFYEGNSYVDKLISNNINHYKNNPSNLNYINFTTISLIQHSFYYRLINQINNDTKCNKANTEKLNCTLHETRIVLVLLRILPKKSDFKKAKFIISNKNVFYKTHIGGNDVSVNGKFDMISMRISDHQDLKFYSQLYKSVESINVQSINHRNVYILNDTKNLDNFLERLDMSNFLDNFTKKHTIVKLGIKYNLRLEFPKYVYVKVSDIIESPETFENSFTSKGIKLPVILKYRGDSKKYNHFLTLILNKEGIQNLIEQFKVSEIKSLYCIIQQYSNHGGLYIKTFLINSQVRSHIRSSLPDIQEGSEKLNSEFQKGFFSFDTKFLSTSAYQEQIQNFPTKTDFNLSIDYKFLEEIIFEFEQYSEKNLISVDFIKDINDTTYYILDCNFYPGFKEFKNQIGELLANHHFNYYEKFKRLNKSNNVSLGY